MNRMTATTLTGRPAADAAHERTQAALADPAAGPAARTAAAEAERIVHEAFRANQPGAAAELDAEMAAAEATSQSEPEPMFWNGASAAAELAAELEAEAG